MAVTVLRRSYAGSAMLAGYGGAQGAPRTHASLGSRLRHPQTTVRWRLTLLYGGMFLVCGAALLAVTYVLVSHQITGGVGIELNVVVAAAVRGGHRHGTTYGRIRRSRCRVPT